jgi:RNA polymerase sigma-70 factor, ECF subfamily
MNLPHITIERTFRQESGQVLATLVGWLRDLELAEDVLQDAFVAALEHWGDDGIPARPGAWMTQVARRKALDRLRKTAGKRRVERLEALLHEPETPETAYDEFDQFPDERLKLMFMCCHPALLPEAQLALILTTLGGLTTAEVAHAFLVPIPTMAQRLVRAKRKIRDAGIPFDVPAEEQIAARLDVMFQVIYLIFTEGYGASQGDALIRQDLCEEAIRLARVVNALISQQRAAIPASAHAEALGLLALLLLHNSRRAARTNAAGDLILLPDQDRSRWDRSQISTGLALLETALARHLPGPYQIQAAISALHAQASSPEATDWPQIAILYGELMLHHPSPVVLLNRAVAVGMAYGPAQGLADLAGLEQALPAYHPLYLARADLLRRLGRTEEARAAYLQALDLCRNQVERSAILRNLSA